MIQALTQAQIDRERWDACVMRTAAGRLYGLSWYLDEICPGWEGVVYDDYAAVLPLVHRQRFGIKYLFLPFSAQQLGVFGLDDPSIIQDMILHIPSRFQLVDLKLNDQNTFSHPNYQVLEHQNFALNLNSSYEQLFAAYSTNARRNVRKAEKLGCTVVENRVSVSSIIEGFKASKGQQFKALDARFYDTLQRLAAACISRGMAETLEVVDGNGKGMTSGLFLRDERRIYYILSANSAEGRNSGAMHALFDHLIRREAGNPLMLDFEGSNDANLARFYGSFGAQSSVYLQVRRNKLPRLLRMLIR